MGEEEQGLNKVNPHQIGKSRILRHKATTVEQKVSVILKY